MVASAGTPLRSARALLLRLGRSLSLAQRFLITAALVVAIAMAVLGNWIGIYLQQAITDGIARTAAASIEALVAHQLLDIVPGQQGNAQQRARLDAAFQIGNDASSTRLLQIRIRDLSGALFYESAGGLVDPADDDGDLEEAESGEVSARIVDVVVAPVGPIAGLPLTVLEIYTPLRRAGSDDVFAAAELYFSAAAVTELRDRAQRDVWVLVGLFGVLVVGALYFFVASADRTIGRQRARLATNLAASRQLSDENRALRDASDALRLAANSANEGLLARVGSDIHDGPIQLLTLIILRLTRAKGAEAADVAATAQLAGEAMEELRNISTGLILPELEDAGIAETIALAITRHEDLTGTIVSRQLAAIDGPASLAVKICAYRVIQEALSNAFRHAGGLGQTVSSAIDGRTLVLGIENDVADGSSQVPASDLPLGLRGMRFRVESLGGDLDLAFGAQQTRVTARIPLGEPPAQA